MCGAVAQLVRALPCHGRGHGFESRRFRHKNLSPNFYMIKKNLGYIFSAAIILICIFLLIQKLVIDEKIKQDTSSASTVRHESNSQTIKDPTTQSQTKKHIIQQGDTLWDLSVKYYGDGSKYHELIKKNPGKTFKFSNGREGLIYPGTELEI